MRCDVVRFVAFEDLGMWEAEIRAHGYEVRYLDAGVDDLEPVASSDLAVCLGGPIDADDARFPVLVQVRELLASRLAADLPTVGICLGAQLMSLALGGTLRRGEREVGWAPVELSADGRDSVLRRLEGAPVLHWHQDVASLPEGATLLASTSGNVEQAWSYGRSLALQFHAEADPESIERWLIGHSGDLDRWGIDMDDLRRGTREAADGATIAGIRLIREYVRAGRSGLLP